MLTFTHADIDIESNRIAPLRNVKCTPKSLWNLGLGLLNKQLRIIHSDDCIMCRNTDKII